MTMTIGAVAALAGVPAATVRYYERRGLLPKAPRTNSGYRKYGPETAERLRVIRRVQALGFSLEEIAELLELRAEEPSACTQAREEALMKVQAVRRKIRDLERMEQVLKELAASCAAGRPTAECPILEMVRT